MSKWFLGRCQSLRNGLVCTTNLMNVKGVFEYITCSLATVGQVGGHSDLPTLIHTHTKNALVHTSNLPLLAHLSKECSPPIIAAFKTNKSPCIILIVKEKDFQHISTHT